MRCGHPRGGTAEGRDEIPPPYSITSSTTCARVNARNTILSCPSRRCDMLRRRRLYSATPSACVALGLAGPSGVAAGAPTRHACDAQASTISNFFLPGMRCSRYDRIVWALANMGYHVSDQTVGNVLRRHDIPPAPERKLAHRGPAVRRQWIDSGSVFAPHGAPRWHRRSPYGWPRRHSRRTRLCPVMAAASIAIGLATTTICRASLTSPTIEPGMLETPLTESCNLMQPID
jgi:hypothetical protein